MTLTAYLAPEDHIDTLTEELGGVDKAYGRLLLKQNGPKEAAWAQNIWLEPVEIQFESIGEAASKLKAIQRNWACYSYDLHRRAALIQEKLPHVSAKPLVFPKLPPQSPMGGWCLLEKNKLLASGKTSSLFPNGEVKFIEDKETPPNRAYLKLWEGFTQAGVFPKEGEVCVDLGSSPGGWTWVMASLGAKVISVDKAELDPKIGKMPQVQFRQESAFGIDPKTLGKLDWMCCDIACYPERLLTLVKKWLEAGNCRNFICTLKFQGETNHAVSREFAAIPGSRLIHLAHNKHELTWIRLAPQA